MSNSNEKIKTGTITEHFPTVSYKNMNVLKRKSNITNKNHVHKPNQSEGNVSIFKNTVVYHVYTGVRYWMVLMQIVIAAILWNKFNEWYDECFPLKNPNPIEKNSSVIMNYKSNRKKKTPQSSWITKGLSKSVNVKTNYINSICDLLQP